MEKKTEGNDFLEFFFRLSSQGSTSIGKDEDLQNSLYCEVPQRFWVLCVYTILSNRPIFGEVR